MNCNMILLNAALAGLLFGAGIPAAGRGCDSDDDGSRQVYVARMARANH
jgi:hypothetical protein